MYDHSSSLPNINAIFYSKVINHPHKNMKTNSLHPKVTAANIVKN